MVILSGCFMVIFILFLIVYVRLRLELEEGGVVC